MRPPQVRWQYLDGNLKFTPRAEIPDVGTIGRGVILRLRIVLTLTIVTEKLPYELQSMAAVSWAIFLLCMPKSEYEADHVVSITWRQLWRGVKKAFSRHLTYSEHRGLVQVIWPGIFPG